jgi:hypothetical protein
MQKEERTHALLPPDPLARRRRLRPRRVRPVRPWPGVAMVAGWISHDATEEDPVRWGRVRGSKVDLAWHGEEGSCAARKGVRARGCSRIAEFHDMVGWFMRGDGGGARRGVARRHGGHVGQS